MNIDGAIEIIGNIAQCQQIIGSSLVSVDDIQRSVTRDFAGNHSAVGFGAPSRILECRGIPGILTEGQCSRQFVIAVENFQSPSILRGDVRGELHGTIRVVTEA